MTALRPGVHRVVGLMLFAVAAVLLTSMGGLGIVAAPATLPRLFLTVRSHPTRPFRIAGAVIGGLTAAELTWGLVYVIGGEVPVASWLLPIAAGLATVFGFATVRPGTRCIASPRPGSTPAATSAGRQT